MSAERRLAESFVGVREPLKGGCAEGVTGELVGVDHLAAVEVVPAQVVARAATAGAEDAVEVSGGEDF